MPLEAVCFSCAARELYTKRIRSTRNTDYLRPGFTFLLQPSTGQAVYHGSLSMSSLTEPGRGQSTQSKSTRVITDSLWQSKKYCKTKQNWCTRQKEAAQHTRPFVRTRKLVHGYSFLKNNQTRTVFLFFLRHYCINKLHTVVRVVGRTMLSHFFFATIKRTAESTPSANRRVAPCRTSASE